MSQVSLSEVQVRVKDSMVHRLDEADIMDFAGAAETERAAVAASRRDLVNCILN